MDDEGEESAHREDNADERRTDGDNGQGPCRRVRQPAVSPHYAARFANGSGSYRPPPPSPRRGNGAAPPVGAVDGGDGAHNAAATPPTNPAVTTSRPRLPKNVAIANFT